MTLAVEDLYRALCASHVQAQGIVDTIDEPVLLLDGRLCVINANPAFLRTFDVEWKSIVGVSLFALGNGQWDIPELRRLLAEVIPKSQAVVGFEVSHDFPSIGRRTMLVNARRLVEEERGSTTLLLAFGDITEARRNIEENDLVLAECKHRIKNALAVVHAIAFQTDVKGLSAQEYRDAFLGRLDAFLMANDLVVRSGDAGVNIAAIIDDAVRSFSFNQFQVEPGPSIQVENAHVRPVRMILHELTTNASKHGAFSRPGGIVHLSWTAIGEGKGANFALDWQEEKGPLVTRPDRLGFGMAMIERSARAIGGNAELHFESDGLRVRILMPMAQEQIRKSI